LQQFIVRTSRPAASLSAASGSLRPAERRSKNDAQRLIGSAIMIAWPILAGMATIRNRRLNPQPRRALELLELLASGPHGAEALLVRAHGFNSDMIAGLIRAGLATAERETMKVGAKPVEVLRVRVTDAGRRAIEG
jgi:hypothetical protein